nr:MAG: tail tube protein [Bacteriophage sp.]
MTFKTLSWDDDGKRFFENGTDRGVLYLKDTDGYKPGVAWNGLTAVTESPDGAEPTDLYADNGKYAVMRSAETLGFTIEAYTYPDEFAACDGSRPIAKGAYVGQQTRDSFGFCYRSRIGNDVNSELAYRLHIYYGCTASPSEKAYETVNDSPDAMTLSWECTTTPVSIAGFKPTASIMVDSRYANPKNLSALENILYGSETAAASLPNPQAIIATLGEAGAVSQSDMSTENTEKSAL